MAECTCELRGPFNTHAFDCPALKAKVKIIGDRDPDWWRKRFPEEAPSLTEQALVMNTLGAPERDASTKDNVVLPEHYARFNIEPIRFICENNLNFFQGNIIKYILRHDAKNGLEDLKKARRYLDMFIEFVEKNPDWWRKDK